MQNPTKLISKDQLNDLVFGATPKQNQPQLPRRTQCDASQCCSLFWFRGPTWQASWDFVGSLGVFMGRGERVNHAESLRIDYAKPIWVGKTLTLQAATLWIDPLFQVCHLH